MRQSSRPQLPLTTERGEHEHARMLFAISDVLDDVPETCDLVRLDLNRATRAKTGRRGMTAEQVLRCLILKQMNGFTYDELAFHIGDSRCYRHFCRFDFAEVTPKRSTLQRNLKLLRAETLEVVNDLLLKSERVLKLEDGRKIRADSTVMETNIHAPADSALLFDCVIVLSRLLGKARKRASIEFQDHRQRAKRRRVGIENARTREDRRLLYKDLLLVTKQTLTYAESAVKTLEELGEDASVALQQKLAHFIKLTLRVVDQTERRVLRNERVPSSEKIVSIFETHTDIIVKDRRETLYGHKLFITAGVSGLVELGVEEVAFSKGRGISVSQMTSSRWLYRKLRNFRAGVESIISFLKRSFGMRRCTWRSLESFKAYAWASILSANLTLIARATLA